ncbi:MAG: TetR/AcrR family transcriptional regulator [Oscillospiraceae bacterium]|jgi:AcrR family transcriptional regulator|nr:TetR/AcrR family transcriptional regulator [Oscillospiraceae bacterium]
MAGRFDAFHALDQEKQTRVIEAALAEFAEKGYARASSNEIARRACVGKGMLFYYFGSKEELYDFLCEYVVEFAKNTYLQLALFESGDFLERYRKLIEIKRRATADRPLHIAFFEKFYREGNAERGGKYIEETAAIYKLVSSSLYDGVDYSMLRDDMDGPTVLSYMKWLFDAYTAESSGRFKRGEYDVTDEAAVAREWRKFDGFVNDMRKLFYKNNHDTAMNGEGI